MILVTGATGNVGRELVAQLHSEGVPVRASSRRPIEGLPPGVETARVDLNNPASFEPALEGVDGVYLTAYGDRLAKQAATFAQAAVRAGVERIAFLSSASVERAVNTGITALHREAEEAVKSSAVAWTLLRPGPFHSNALWWAARPIAAGERVIRHPFGNEPAAPIDAADIAAVAAAALTSADHAGNAYLLTGGEQVTPQRQLEILGEVLSRELVFQQMSYSDARDFVAGFFDGEPDAAVIEEMLDELLETDLPWREPVPTVEAITGRPPRPFRDWAVEHADAFS